MTITRIKQRRGTAAAWTAANPTLDSAEFGVETDTGKIKLGDGSTAWTALNYLLEDAALTGTPTAPTAAPGTDTTQIATTAFVGTAVDNATSGVTELIAETVLASDAATVTFSAIPQTYRHLMLVGSVRGTAVGAGFAFVDVRLNGDAAANYLRQLLRAVGSTVDALAQAVTAASVGAMPNASAPAGYFGGFEIVLPDYQATRPQSVISRATAVKGATTADTRFEHNGVVWLGTTAITSIEVKVQAGDFAAGSVVSLYGMKGA